MSLNSENFQLPPSFTGIVRLFPLPNLVLFPGVIQPLHIFEMRYRQLMEDALAADELIAMALMKPGWEPHYEGRPEIFPTVCIGRIMTYTRLNDGRFNLLLQGVARGQIVREIGTDRLYRMAEVQIARPVCQLAKMELAALAKKVRHQFTQLCESGQTVDSESLHSLVGKGLQVDLLADLIAFALDTSPREKQSVLESNDVGERLALVSQQLSRQLHRETKRVVAEFPPCFSAN